MSKVLINRHSVQASVSIRTTAAVSISQPSTNADQNYSQSTVPPTPTNQSDSAMNKDIVYNFKCELCGEHFPHKGLYFDHLDPYHCEQCNCILFLKYAFLIHVQEHSETKHQCKLCPKLYSLQSSLYNHYKTHRVKLYKCPLDGCNYSVRSE